MVWDVEWAWENDTKSGDLSLAEWKEKLDGGLVLRAPERWLGIPFRHAWSMLNGRRKRALEKDVSIPTGAAYPYQVQLVERSESLLRSRMIRLGFLDGHLEIESVPVSDHKVGLKVILNPGPHYACAETRVEHEWSGLGESEVLWLEEEWAKWRGKGLDLDALESERERFARHFERNGWYGLISDYFTIGVDTTGSRMSQQVGLTLQVSPILSNEDTIPHRLARLDSISFKWHSESNPINTCRLAEGVWWDVPWDRDVRGVSHRMHLQSKVLYDPQSVYAARQAVRLFPLIEDVRVKVEALDYPREGALPLHVHFDAFPSERRVINMNGAVTSRQGPGAELAISLSDQDFRKRMEQISLNAGLGIEMVIPYNADASAPSAEEGLIPSRVISGGLTYNTHRLIPFAPARFPRSNKPESRLSISVRDENRPNFNRTYLQVGLVERFVENPASGSRIELRPFEIALTSSNLLPEFREELDNLGSDILTSSFESRALFVSGINWQLRPAPRMNSPWNWKLDLEFEGAGNLFHWIDARNPEETYVPLPSVFGGTSQVQVARYLRSVLEAKGGWSPDGRNGFFARGIIGVSASTIPGVAVPLEKQFYVGGPNSMRGWQALGLGPGGSNELGVRVRGDMRIEFNLEARKYVNDWIQLAAFADAGNVWMTRPEESRPEVEFAMDKFLGQMALSVGGGLRLDFGYFLLRCDAGKQLFTPGAEMPTEPGWRIHPAVALPF